MIRVKFYGPSDTKGARFVVTDGMRQLIVPYQYKDFEQECFEAAKRFRDHHLQLAPELDPTPQTFRSSVFYIFKK